LAYEVVDGFKRLERWRGAGAQRVPVVVEDGLEPYEAKRLLLLSNTPPRTLSAMDEARVVASLRQDEGLGKKTIARVLHKKPHWVEQRLAIAHGLSPAAMRKVDAGKVGPTLAYALVGLSTASQEAVLCAVERHGLGPRQAVTLVSALRAANGHKERERLLAAPRELFARPAGTLGAAAARLEERLRRAQQVLRDLSELELPEDLSLAERRRLGALHRAVFAEIHTLARRETGIAEPDITLPRQEDVYAQRDPEPKGAGEEGGPPPLPLPGGASGDGERREVAPAAPLALPDVVRGANGAGAGAEQRDQGGAGADRPSARSGGGGDTGHCPGDRPRPEARAARLEGGGAAQQGEDPGGAAFEPARQAG
jgi:hypothetical protein